MMNGSFFIGFHLAGLSVFFGLVLLAAWMIKHMKKESLLNTIKWILVLGVVLWILSGLMGYRYSGATNGWQFMRNMMNWSYVEQQ